MPQHFRLPLQIVIPTPMPSVIQHGIHATTTFERHVKFRCNKRQQDEIDLAAQLCGMKRADFVRFCATHTARKIIEITSDETQ